MFFSLEPLEMIVHEAMVNLVFEKSFKIETFLLESLQKLKFLQKLILKQWSWTEYVPVVAGRLVKFLMNAQNPK